MKKYTPLYDNPLYKPTSLFFESTSNLDGIIHQTIVWQNRILKEAEKESFHMIGITPITSFDLTSETAPLEETPYNIIKAIDREEYVSFINEISNREVGYTISQCYEYFETFLYDILATYIKVKCNTYKGKNDYREIRKLLKKELQGKNNAEAFVMLREESKVYKKFEQSNTSKINIVDWYTVFSIARHSITHSASSIRKEDYNRLGKVQQMLFNSIFPHTVENDLFLIKPTYNTFRTVIEYTHAHTNLIFKGLSESLDIESLGLENTNEDRARV